MGWKDYVYKDTTGMGAIYTFPTLPEEKLTLPPHHTTLNPPEKLTHKVCNRCDQVKRKTEFGRHRGRCQKCEVILRRERRQKRNLSLGLPYTSHPRAPKSTLEGYKICVKCKLELLKSQFYHKSKDLLHERCKSCYCQRAQLQRQKKNLSPSTWLSPLIKPKVHQMVGQGLVRNAKKLKEHAQKKREEFESGFICCSLCQKIKPLDSFYLNNRWNCKECLNARQKEKRVRQKLTQKISLLTSQ